MQKFRNIDIDNLERSGYIIQQDGNILSVKGRQPKYLRQCVNNCGYHVVNLRHSGKSELFLVHRLVAEKWIDKDAGKEYINHINGNKSDNTVENLEWCTHSHNVQHAYDTGLLVLTR